MVLHPEIAWILEILEILNSSILLKSRSEEVIEYNG